MCVGYPDAWGPQLSSWHHVGLPSSPKSRLKCFARKWREFMKQSGPFAEWVWHLVAHMPTLPSPIAMADTTNWWYHSFLLSPDRTSESFPKEHTGHMLLMDWSFRGGWNPVVISPCSISITSHSTLLRMVAMADPAGCLPHSYSPALGRVHTAGWRLKRSSPHFPSLSAART